MRFLRYDFWFYIILREHLRDHKAVPYTIYKFYVCLKES